MFSTSLLFVSAIATMWLLLSQPTANVDIESACSTFDEHIERLDLNNARSVLTGAYSEAPAQYDVLYRMARLHVLLGDAEPNEDKQLSLYEKALDYGNKAVAANGRAAGGYVYRAAANGKIALFKGIFSVGEVVAKVRDDAWYAIKLNTTPRLTAAAHYILGRTHLSLSAKPKILRGPLGLGWGNLDEAQEHLRKARELRPGFIMFELEYARCLAELDRESDAIDLARKIASMKLQEPGDPKRKQEALELINDLE